VRLTPRSFAYAPAATAAKALTPRPRASTRPAAAWARGGFADFLTPADALEPIPPLEVSAIASAA
jgi:hypothetical protein